jgi:hypothetical protein
MFPIEFFESVPTIVFKVKYQLTLHTELGKRLYK